MVSGTTLAVVVSDSVRSTDIIDSNKSLAKTAYHFIVPFAKYCALRHGLRHCHQYSQAYFHPRSRTSDHQIFSPESYPADRPETRSHSVRVIPVYLGLMSVISRNHNCLSALLSRSSNCCRHPGRHPVVRIHRLFTDRPYYIDTAETSIGYYKWGRKGMA